MEIPFLTMQHEAFLSKLKQNPRPVVVDLWAPWCGPCKIVKPILEKLAQEYKGKVDLWQINADENPDLLRQLGVYGIPTMIVYRGGEEVKRYVGAKPAAALKDLFETLSTGGELNIAALSMRDRVLRLGVGTAILIFGISSSVNWILIGIGLVVMFTAVYDRCPIWRALTSQFKRLTGNS